MEQLIEKEEEWMLRWLKFKSKTGGNVLAISTVPSLLLHVATMYLSTTVLQ